jgi:hypothetical protein
MKEAETRSILLNLAFIGTYIVSPFASHFAVSPQMWAGLPRERAIA